MAGETSGPGPSEQEIRMVALERKFDELLSFVQLIAKRNTDDENQRKEDDKDTSEAEPEGHSNTNATPPRPPTPPKPEGKDSQLDSKIDSLEEKIRLIQGNAAEWYSQLKKISHWKELADTFLAQYGFNSQIAPDRFDLQRMEKKSNETFREYAQRWREKAARARPPLDEREMIKIFVDTLKNPYFDRMMGLQMQFFVDLIPVGERIEDALKTKKIVDMTALMALAEQASRQEGSNKEEGRGCANDRERSNGRPRQILPTFTMQSVKPRPTPTPAPTQVPAPAPAPQMPARSVGNQPNDNRWPRKEPRQFTAFTYALPMPMTELYPILIEKSLISPTIPRPYNGAPRKDFNQNLTCDFHFGEVGHAIGNCNHLRHRVQDLIDHGILKFEGLPNITTNPLPNHPEGGVNMCGGGELRRDLEAQRGNVSTLRTMNEFIREQLEISEDAKDQLEETLAETREQLETEQAERTRVQDELDSLRSYTQALVDPATGRPQDIVALRRALDASEEALTSARTSMGVMRVQISVLQGDNGVLQSELDLGA
uniref:Retrotransposon gag domain-containing protein n=1 Tax=Fagus sylvatica TaxID=28930 RepID=A0A2N9HNV9_FAGSY